MKIAVLHIYNFPYELAPTTRITAYCKGLKKLGVQVDIVSIVPKKCEEKEPLIGECDGGTYYHFAYKSKCNMIGFRGISYRIKHRYCIFRALQFIKKSHRKKPYDAIILSFDEPFQFNYIVPFLYRLSGIKIIAIADEYPIPIRQYLKPAVPQSKLNQYKKIYRKIDARILMTSKLQEFYDSKISPKPTLILSTIVDTDRFKLINKVQSNISYLCYMGNMELSKDNVDNIIYAFNIIKEQFPDLFLYLYGAPSEKDKNMILQIIKKLDLEGRVLFKGKASYLDVPSILQGATILVASQPNTKRAEGGFPTKMGEYFMTGKPTILTDVGEISNYVKHQENAYMVVPENPYEYAKMISYVLNNYQEALNVAQNAKSLIYNKYSYEAAGKNIVNFINTLK